jgi:transcriptional regulator GlxA family with amidase domain
MNHKAKQERQKRKEARINQAKVLSGAKPSPSRAEAIDRMMKALEAKISEVRSLLALADRLVASDRCRGLIAGLKAGTVNSSTQ